MSFKMINGFRKNRYFDEEKLFEKLKEIGKLSINGKRSEGVKSEVEIEEMKKGGSLIDEHILKMEKRELNIKNKEDIEIKGSGLILYNIEGNAEIQLNYSKAAVMEIYRIKKNSRVEIKSRVEESYVHRIIYLEEGAKVEAKTASPIENNKIVEVINRYFLKKGSNAFESFSILNSGMCRVYSELNHLGEKSRAESNAKAICKENGKLSVEGIIKIKENAKNVESFLDERVILLDEAEAHAFPALEIKNKDVRASHSASIKQIEEEDLFYMQNRGIDKESAKELIIESFLGELIFQSSKKEMA